MRHIPASVGAAYRVHVDNRRRPTLPSAVLLEAGIAVDIRELVARSDGRGRVVLEDPLARLFALQESMVFESRESGDERDLALELIDERRDDSSLD